MGMGSQKLSHEKTMVRAEETLCLGFSYSGNPIDTLSSLELGFLLDVVSMQYITGLLLFTL